MPKRIFCMYTGSYDCKKDWPEDCQVQGGSKGVVIVRKGINYETAFFEAFPAVPATFIRGEGKTIEEAEAKAWEKFERQSKCSHPSFERRNYTNGAAFCTECGMFSSKHFEPLTKCGTCGKPTHYTLDQVNDIWYCEEHRRNNEHPSPLVSDFWDKEDADA